MTSPNTPDSNPSTGWGFAQELSFLSLTQIAQFCRCPRMFFYSVICQLTEPVAHPALTFGTSIGAGLPEMSVGDASTRLERALAKFNEAWGDADSLGDSKRNSFNGIQIFRHYAEQPSPGNGLYEVVIPPPSLLQSGKGISPLEVPFAFLLGDLPVPLIGSVDGILRDRVTGQLWAREIKTTSEWTHSMLAENFRRNPQSTGYAWALRRMGQMMGDAALANVVGTVLELIGVPDPGKTARAKPQYQVTTHPQPFLSTYTQTFEQFLMRRSWEIIERLRRQDFDEDFSACAGYSQFGKATFPCRYQLLCEQDDWSTLAGMFVARRHEPFDLTAGLPTPLTIAGKELVSETL